MVSSYFGYIIGTLIVLAIVMIIFLCVDKLLKSDTKKSTEPAKDKPAVEEPIEKTPEVKVPVMEIYNSELADDLNELLKNAESSTDSRLNVESHLNRESNISKYIQEKKYESFNFANEHDTTDHVENEPMTFTRDDYKKFMALSNIDDKK